MKIIAICGQKGTGKDLVAHTICELLPNVTTKKMEFGDGVTRIVDSVFQLHTRGDHTHFAKGMITMPNGYTIPGKDIIKTLTSQIRKVNPQFFINSLEDQILKFKGYHPDEYETAVFVITDLRFKDEVKWCRQNKIPIIKVKRDTGVCDMSVDEADIDDFLCNYIIDNNSEDPSHLTNQVQNILTKIV